MELEAPGMFRLFELWLTIMILHLKDYTTSQVHPLANVGSVCKLWNEWSRTPELWAAMELNEQVSYAYLLNSTSISYPKHGTMILSAGKVMDPDTILKSAARTADMDSFKAVLAAENLQVLSDQSRLVSTMRMLIKSMNESLTATPILNDYMLLLHERITEYRFSLLFAKKNEVQAYWNDSWILGWIKVSLLTSTFSGSLDTSPIAFILASVWSHVDSAKMADIFRLVGDVSLADGKGLLLEILRAPMVCAAIIGDGNPFQMLGSGLEKLSESACDVDRVMLGKLIKFRDQGILQIGDLYDLNLIKMPFGTLKLWNISWDDLSREVLKGVCVGEKEMWFNFAIEADLLQ